MYKWLWEIIDLKKNYLALNPRIKCRKSQEQILNQHNWNLVLTDIRYPFNTSSYGNKMSNGIVLILYNRVSWLIAQL